MTDKKDLIKAQEYVIKKKWEQLRKDQQDLKYQIEYLELLKSDGNEKT